MIGNKICNFITLYRSPSQNQDDFQAFIDNLCSQDSTAHWCSQDSANLLLLLKI